MFRFNPGQQRDCGVVRCGKFPTLRCRLMWAAEWFSMAYRHNGRCETQAGSPRPRQCAVPQVIAAPLLRQKFRGNKKAPPIVRFGGTEGETTYE